MRLRQPINLTECLTMLMRCPSSNPVKRDQMLRWEAWVCSKWPKLDGNKAFIGVQEFLVACSCSKSFQPTDFEGCIS